MSYSIVDIEGIGKQYGMQLAKAGVKTTGSLLKACCDRKGRSLMAKKAGVSEHQLLKWANMADLMRIKGVGPEFAELLEAAGVDTVKELKMRTPQNLVDAMQRTNKMKRLTRRVPTKSMVQGWVAQAKTLKPLITH